MTNASSFPFGIVIARIALILGIIQIINLIRKYKKAIASQDRDSEN